MNKNVLVVGLDGATWKVINPLIKKNKLPFLAKLKKQSLAGISQSTLPPLTPSVWTSFLTGVNPGKHGIFGFLNYRKENKSFFSAKDIKYEPINKQIKSYISFANLNGLIKIAGTETHEVTVDQLIASASQKVTKFIKFTSKNPNTAFNFILFKEVDIAQHLLWGTKQLTEFYKKLDSLLEKLYETYYKSSKAEKTFIVVSDHGFHKAANIQFSIYPYLVDYLDKNINILSKEILLAKPAVWNIVQAVNAPLKGLGLNISKVPLVKDKRKKLIETLEERKAREFLEKYGMRITFEGLYFYNSIVAKKSLVKSLKAFTYKGKKVFASVCLAEETYKGPFFDQGPDIVFMPSEKFHLNISTLETNVFSKFVTDIPADHMSDINGIYMVDSQNKKLTSIPATIPITDFRPLISDLLGISKPFGMDGISPIADYSSLDKKIAEAKRVLQISFKKHGSSVAIAFTGRKDSLVTLDLLRQVCKESKLRLPRIIFIDHGEHFSESYKFLKQIAKKWNLNINWEKTTRLNKESLAESKIRSLEESIAKYRLKALITAIRADESTARSNELFFSKRKTHVRVHPVLKFTENDIWEYIKRFNLPYNPLYDKGYRSLEEKKTTKKVVSYKQSERLGRDRNKEKVMESLRKLGYF